MTATPEELERRRLEALKLRIAGYSYREISAATGVAVSVAHHDVVVAMRPTIVEREDLAVGARALECMRLDRLWRRWFPLALGETANGEPSEEPPDEGAANMCMKVTAMRCKILGLEAPQRIEVARPVRRILSIGAGGVVTDVTPATVDDDGASEQ